MLSSARKAPLLFFLFLLFSFFLTFRLERTHAVTSSVVINEIAWMGTSASSSDEWLEFYNTASSPIDISNWSIYGADTGKVLNFSAADGETTTVIPANGYLIYANDKDAVRDSSGNSLVDIWDATIGLNDTFPGQVILYDGLDGGGNVMDTANQTGGDWLAGTKTSRATMERIDPVADGAAASNWGTNDGVTVNGKDANGNSLKGTPKAQNSVYKVSYPTGIYLWEYLPNPAEGNEWVEIYNDNAESKTLSNWQIDDVQDGGSSPKSFSITLSGKGYFKFDLGTTTFFNNDGDTVRLLRPDGSEVEKTSFTESFRSVAFAKDGSGSWWETKTPTPGETNIMESPIHKTTLAEIKKLTLGSRVSFEADVTAPPDLLGDDDFYVHDKETGIKVHCTCELIQEYLQLGDKVKVASTLEESYGEKYIKTSAVDVLERGRPQVASDEIRTGEVGEAQEGNLVRVGGTVEDLEENAFYVNDGTGRVRIYFKDASGVPRPQVKREDEASVLGLVSQYGHLENGSPNYRVLPRYSSDVEILPVTVGKKGGVLGATAKSDLAAAVSPSLPEVKKLPRTGLTDDFYRWGYVFLFFSLSLRLWSEQGLKDQPAHGEDEVEENKSDALA